MGYRLVLDNVYYKYPGQNQYALAQISLSFSNGAIYGIIGSNGAGKTTLLKIIGLLYRPTLGKITFNGENPWERNLDSYRKEIVYVHEKPIMLRTTVYENLLYPLKLRNISEVEARERINSIAAVLEMEHLLEKKAYRLSTGQKQLVGIARALLVNPKVIALDEPFSNLDFKRKKLVISLLRRLVNEGKTVIVSSHDTLTIERISKEITVLDNGKIIFHGPKHEALKILYS